MRPAPFLVAAIALVATPAATQNPPAEPPTPPPSSYMGGGPPDLRSSPFRLEDTRRQCFNGKFILGSNREGARTLYVQPQRGGVYRLDLTQACDALDAASHLTVRADSDDVVCEGQRAMLVLKTPLGAKRCAVGEVRRLNPREMAALASAARR